MISHLLFSHSEDTSKLRMQQFQQQKERRLV